jgi:outer membrane protein OmpA-like peptidoglycan-associated protein
VTPRGWACGLLLAALAAGLAGAVQAQSAAGAQGAPAAPGTRQMIDALKPGEGRGRNLLVRPAATVPAPAPAAPAAPPAAVPAPAAPAPVPPPALSPQPAPAAPPPAPPPPAALPSAPAQPPALVPVPAPGPGPSLSLPIQFEPNSARVKPESGGLLGDLVAAMISPELQDSRFVIEGHTDARGNASANRRLSQERAEEVRQYLILLGVHASRLQAVGKGSSEPANPRDPLAPENRRVRVVTLE